MSSPPLSLLFSCSSLLLICSSLLFFCSFVAASPIQIDLAPSIVGVETEDRISNPSSSSSNPASSATGGVAATGVVGSGESRSGAGAVLVNSGEPKAASSPSSASSSSSSSSSSATSADIISIGDIFSPDVTSVDVTDEERTHREEPAARDKEGGCVGEGCACPPGTKGRQPFCTPISAGTGASEEVEEVGDEEIPLDFYKKIAAVKNVQEFINLTNIVVPLVVPAAPSLTTLPAEGCIPKKVCVSVRPKNRHPAEDVFPHSIDVERCGGCCGHPDLACLPWSTEPMTVKLLKYGYNPDGTLTNLGFTTTSVIREIKCKCVQVQT